MYLFECIFFFYQQFVVRHLEATDIVLKKQINVRILHIALLE